MDSLVLGEAKRHSAASRQSASSYTEEEWHSFASVSVAATPPSGQGQGGASSRQRDSESADQRAEEESEGFSADDAQEEEVNERDDAILSAAHKKKQIPKVPSVFNLRLL